MKTYGLIFLFGVALIAGCGGSAPGTSSGVAKLTGPPVQGLETAQLNDIDSQCFTKYGSVDDARVPYTQEYCHQVEVERNRRSLSVSKPEQDRNKAVLSLGKSQ